MTLPSGNRDIFEIDKGLGLHSGNSGHAPVICSYCNSYVGPSPRTGFRDGDISHGICEECCERIRKEMNLPEKMGLDIPVS